MNRQTTIRRADRAVFRELSGDAGAVILHLDTGQYHGINDVGRLIWETIGEGSSLAEVVDVVRLKTEGYPAALESEVMEFLDALAARGLVTIGESPIAS